MKATTTNLRMDLSFKLYYPPDQHLTSCARFVFHAADGACYELNTPGPCPRDTAAVAGCQGTPCFMRCARADNILLQLQSFIWSLVYTFGLTNSI